MIGIDGQSFARWGKSGKVPKWADKLVRLVYIAKAEGNQPINKAIERIQNLERLVGQCIVLTEKKGHWQPSLKNENEMAVAA